MPVGIVRQSVRCRCGGAVCMAWATSHRGAMEVRPHRPDRSPATPVRVACFCSPAGRRSAAAAESAAAAAAARTNSGVVRRMPAPGTEATSWGAVLTIGTLVEVAAPLCARGGRGGHLVVLCGAHVALLEVTRWQGGRAAHLGKEGLPR